MFFAACTFAACTFACGRESVRLELPDTTGSKSLLIAVEQNELRLTAMNLDPFARVDLLPVLDPLADHAYFAVAMYPGRLETLGITEGAVAEEHDADRMLPLPAAASYHQVEIDDGVAAPWASLDAAPEALAAFRYRSGQELCRRFEETAIQVGFVTVALMPDADGALVLHRQTRKLFKVTPLGRQELGAFSADPTMSPSSAWRNMDGGEVFIGAVDGIIFRGMPGGMFRQMPPLPSARVAIALAGPIISPAPFELYALDVKGGFFRYDEVNGWKTLADSVLDENFNNPPSMLWLGPEHIVAVPAQVRNIDQIFYEYSGADRARDYALPSGQLGLIESLALYEGRPVALTTLTNVLRIGEGGIIDKIGEPPSVNDPRVIVSYEDGIVYGGSGSSFVQLVPKLGYCTVKSSATQVVPDKMINFHDGLIVSARATGDMLFLRRLPPMD